ncbi:MAG TPA: VOC family protein [Actinocrinis sp.]|jgi:hypothetical protein
MVYGFQVVFDCADPPRLARFWQQALGYVEEAPPAGFASWPDFLVANKVPESEWDRLGSAVPPDFDGATGQGSQPRLLFAKVPEAKAVKNRVHLDIAASGGRSVPPGERWPRVLARAAQLEELGATRLREYDELGSRWIVMADPEGNEFCVH